MSDYTSPNMPTPNSSGNWAEYQRLVLTELERHNVLMREIDARLQKLSIELALAQRDSKIVTDFEDRLRKLEESAITTEAIDRYRKWIFGILFALLVSVLIPLARLFFTGG